MAVDIIAPPLSQTMDTMILVEWLKDVGEEIVKGEPLFVVETDKANLDVESPATGTLRQIFAEPGTEVKVRAKIGVIAAPHETIPHGPGMQPGPEPQAIPLPTTATTPCPPSLTTGPEGRPLPPERQNRIFASPRARQLARREGVSMAAVQATGPQGMIVERDVRAYLEQRKAALAPREIGRPVGLSPTRRTIARRMWESHRSTAPVTLNREVDATELVHLQERILQELSEEDTRPTYTDFLITIVAQRLKRHPHLNATTDGEGSEFELKLSEDVHVGMAVDTERGLVVPVIRHADRKGLLELARERADLVRRAMEGTVTPEELTGGTFTITNLGGLGVDTFTPIINPPQVAILGVGRTRPAPAVHEGEICIRQLMYLSLTFDHRVVDGAPAARFLQDLNQLIEKPHLQWLF